MRIYDIEGTVLAYVHLTKDAVHEEELMKSNFVRLSWEDNIGDELPVGAYIVPFEDGIHYTLFDAYTPERKGENRFLYRPEFQHPVMWLSRIPFLHHQGDTSEGWEDADKKYDWTYTGSPEMLAGRVVEYINWLASVYDGFGDVFCPINSVTGLREQWTAIVSDGLSPLESVSFQSVDVMSAAASMASTWDCEYHFDFDRRIFYFGNIAHDIGDSTQELKVGREIGTPSVTISKENYHNAYVVLGSTKNLSKESASGGHVQVTERLTLDPEEYPDSIIYVNEDGEEITREEFLASGMPMLTRELIFDDVYPKLYFYMYGLYERRCYLLNDADEKVDDYTTPSGKAEYSKWYFKAAYYDQKQEDSIGQFYKDGQLYYWHQFKLKDNVVSKVREKQANNNNAVILELPYKSSYLQARSTMWISAVVDGTVYACEGGELDGQMTLFGASIYNAVSVGTVVTLPDIDSQLVPEAYRDSLIIKDKTLGLVFQPNYDAEPPMDIPLVGQEFDVVHFKTETTEKEKDDIEPLGHTAYADDFRIVQKDGTPILPSTSTLGLVPKAYNTPDYRNNIITFVNIVVADEFKLQAQAELKAAAMKEIARIRLDNNTYSFNAYPEVFKEHNPNLVIGQKVVYNDGRDLIGEDAYTLTTHVRKLVTRLDFGYIQEITVGNEKIKGSISSLKDNINTIVTGSGGGGANSGNGTMSEEQFVMMMQNYGSRLFLSKTADDTANGLITFLKGLVSKADLVVEGNGWFKKMLTAVSAVIDNIRSSNFSGWGVADAGYQLTSDYNGTGKSGLVVDYIYARMKLVAEALELKKYEVSAGDQMYSMAANYINRTEYLTDEDVSVGWSEEKVPWLLRGMPLTLRKTLTGNQVFGIFARKRKIRMHIENTDVRNIAKVRCYFLAKDGDRDVENWWRVGDLARCQTLNVVSSRRDDYVSVERKAGNVFWWRKVIGVSTNDGAITWKNKETGEIKTQQQYEALTDEQKEQYIRNYNGTKTQEGEEHSGLPVMIDGKEYHWIDIAYDYDLEHAGTGGAETEWSGAAILSDIPCAGDTAVQFGNDGDPNRMNLMTLELNGLMNADAPCIKIYKGIYTYDLNKCWWGGKARKMLLSPSTGYEFYGPSFKFVQEYGIARVPTNRGAWYSIPFHRDEYDRSGTRPISYSDDSTSGRQSGYVRECYYYDQVTHNGSLWLCVASSLETGGGAHWVKPQVFDDADYALFDSNGDYQFNGDYISNSDYNALSDSYKIQCGRIPNYIVSEPSDNNPDWQKQVAKGDAGQNVSTLDIDNEFDMVPTDSTGRITEARTIETIIRLYDGSTEIDISNVNVNQTGGITVSGGPSYIVAPFTPSAEPGGGKGKKLSWAFVSGQVMNAVYEVEISYTYQQTLYKATFTISASKGQAIYQIKPSMSSIPFAYTNGTYSPASRNVELEIVKIDGESTTSLNVFSNTGTVDSGKVFVRYSTSEMPTGKTSGTAWPEGTGTTVTVSNSGVTNLYIAVFNANNVLLDRETIPVVKDGTAGPAAADTYLLTVNPAAINFNEATWPLYINFNIKKSAAGGAISDVTSVSSRTTEGLHVLAQIKETSSGSIQWYDAGSEQAFEITKTYAELTPVINIQLRKTKSGQTYDESDASTYDVVDLKSVVVAKDGADGYDVSMNPAVLIINQSLTKNSSNEYTFDTPHLSSVAASTGSTSLYGKITNVFQSASVYVNGSYYNATGNPFTIKIGYMNNGSFVENADGDTIQVYAVRQVTYSSTAYYPSKATISLTIALYNSRGGTSLGISLSRVVTVGINLLGTYEETIVADTKTEVARSLTYGYDPQSQQLIALENFGSYIRSSEVNISTLQQTVGDENGGLVQKTSQIEQRVDQINLEVSSLNSGITGRNYLIGSAFVTNDSAAGNLAIDDAFFNALPNEATNEVYIGVSCYVRIAAEDTGTDWANYNTYDYKNGSRSADHRIGFEVKLNVGNTNTHTLPCWGLPNGYTGSGYNSAYVANYNNTTHYVKASVGSLVRIKRAYKITYSAGSKPTSASQLQYFNQLLGTNSGGTQGYSMSSCVGFAKLEILSAQDVNLITDWSPAVGETINTAANLIDFKGVVGGDTWTFTASGSTWENKLFPVMGLSTAAGIRSLIDGKIAKVWIDAKITALSGQANPNFYLFLTDGYSDGRSRYNKNSYMGCNLQNGCFSEPSPDHAGYTRYYMYQRFFERVSASGNVIPNTQYSTDTNEAGKLYASFARGSYDVAGIGISLTEISIQDGLEKSGIYINSGEIVLNSASVKIKNGNTTAAMFEDGKIKADYIQTTDLDVSGTFTVKHMYHTKLDVTSNISLPGSDDEYLYDTYKCAASSQITINLSGIESAGALYEGIELTFINTSTNKVKLSGHYFSFIRLKGGDLEQYYNQNNVYIPGQGVVKIQLALNSLQGWGATWYVVSGLVTVS